MTDHYLVYFPPPGDNTYTWINTTSKNIRLINKSKLKGEKKDQVEMKFKNQWYAHPGIIKYVGSLTEVKQRAKKLLEILKTQGVAINFVDSENESTESNSTKEKGICYVFFVLLIYFKYTYAYASI